MNDTTETTPTNKRLSIPIGVKYTAGNGSGEFSGWGATFNGIDSYNDTIAPGAFAKTIADHRSRSTSPALLWSHDMSQPIGAISQLTETAYGLKVDGQLALGVERGRDAYELFKMSALGLSIGYRPTKTTPNGKAGRTLNEVMLFEISAVSIPADSRSVVTNVKARPDLIELNNPRVTERILRDAGYGREQSKLIVSLAKKAYKQRDVVFQEQILARKLIAATAALSSFSQ
jgi:HK97 family phage prohead protease